MYCSLWAEIGWPKSQLSLQPQLETKAMERPRTMAVVGGQLDLFEALLGTDVRMRAPMSAVGGGARGTVVGQRGMRSRGDGECGAEVSAREGEKREKVSFLHRWPDAEEKASGGCARGRGAKPGAWRNGGQRRSVLATRAGTGRGRLQRPTRAVEDFFCRGPWDVSNVARLNVVQVGQTVVEGWAQFNIQTNFQIFK
jgi:hypothetical protein